MGAFKGVCLVLGREPRGNHIFWENQIEGKPFFGKTMVSHIRKEHHIFFGLCALERERERESALSGILVFCSERHPQSGVSKGSPAPPPPSF